RTPARSIWHSIPAILKRFMPTRGPGRTPRRPQVGINRLRIAGIECQIDRAGVLVLVQNLLPGGAAVQRAKDATLGIRAIGVSQSRNQHPVGIPGINDDCANLLGVTQAQMLPALSAIGGFVDAVAYGKIWPPQTLAAAHINDLGI